MEENRDREPWVRKEVVQIGKSKYWVLINERLVYQLLAGLLNHELINSKLEEHFNGERSHSKFSIFFDKSIRKTKEIHDELRLISNCFGESQKELKESLKISDHLKRSLELTKIHTKNNYGIKESKRIFNRGRILYLITAMHSFCYLEKKVNEETIDALSSFNIFQFEQHITENRHDELQERSVVFKSVKGFLEKDSIVEDIYFNADLSFGLEEVREYWKKFFIPKSSLEGEETSPKSYEQFIYKAYDKIKKAYPQP